MFSSLRTRFATRATPLGLALGLGPLLLTALASPDATRVIQSAAGDLVGIKVALAQPANASGTGTVNGVNAAQRKMNLSHDAIPALKWPSMTMDFPVSAAVDLSKVQPGSKIQFSLSRGPNGYVIESVRPAQ